MLSSFLMSGHLASLWPLSWAWLTACSVNFFPAPSRLFICATRCLFPRELSFLVPKYPLIFLAGWLGLFSPRPLAAFQFFGFLLVIFAIEIAAAIWGYSHKDEVGFSHEISWVWELGDGGQ